MLVGNPYQFAVIAKIVSDWNQNDITPFYNGVLLICIDGQLFPKHISTATLGVDIPYLEKALSNIAINGGLFKMVKEKAFLEIYKATFPSLEDIECGVNENYRYCLSPQSLSDCDCIIFAVSDGKQVRILAADLKYVKEESTHDLNNIDIIETFIMPEEIEKISCELEKVLE